MMRQSARGVGPRGDAHRAGGRSSMGRPGTGGNSGGGGIWEEVEQTWEGARLNGVDGRKGGPGAGFFDKVVSCRTDPRVRLAFQVPAQKDVRGATTSSSLKVWFHLFWKLFL